MGKRIRLETFLLLFLCSGSLLVTVAGAGFNGYTVDPVTPGMDTGTPLETVSVDFWGLPPQVMAISLAVSLSPVIAFPVELLFFLKLFAYLGYRKVEQHSVFHNAARNRIYSCIQDNPGIFFNALSRKTDVKRGSLRYHLTLLKLMGKIAVLDTHGNTRYFENSGKFSEPEKKVLKYLQNDTDCRILTFLLYNPDITRKDLVRHLGIAGSTVTWYMNRLSDENLICVQKTGKNVRYEINPESRRILQKYLAVNNDLVSLPFAEGMPECS
jgi:predicted transcriptional regulator